MKRKGGHLDPRVYTIKAYKSSNFFIWVYLSALNHHDPDLDPDPVFNSIICKNAPEQCSDSMCNIYNYEFQLMTAF